MNTWQGNGLFDARERAALAYVEQATMQRKVDSDVFVQLALQFTQNEIVELTWLNALENFLNLTTVPLEIGFDNLCALRHRG